MADPFTGLILFLSALLGEPEMQPQPKNKVESLATYTEKQRVFEPEIIQIVVLNNPVPKEVTDGLANKLSTRYNIPVPVARYEEDIKDSFISARHQFDGVKLLDQLALPVNDKTYTIYVIGDDLYAGDYNFLFAYTNFKDHETVLSTYRFLDQNTPPQTAIDRLDKVMMRRIGFAFGLDSDDCIMHFANSLDELDKTPAEYCPTDQSFLENKNILRK